MKYLMHFTIGQKDTLEKPFPITFLHILRNNGISGFFWKNLTDNAHHMTIFVMFIIN